MRHLVGVCLKTSGAWRMNRGASAGSVRSVGSARYRGTSALDPELAASLAMAEKIDPFDLAQQRELHRGNAARFDPSRHPDVEFGHLEIDDASGEARLRLRTCRPVDSSDPLPVFLSIHGGAFSFGQPENDDELAAFIASSVRCVVISPDYRLAPEFPFPAGVEDAYATLEWIARAADDHGFRRDRIVVGGNSAGGGLAAAVCLMSRDRNGPRVAHQLLIYPVLDDRLTTDSMQEFVSAPVFDQPQAELMWARYLGDDGEPVSPYAAPSRAEDLSGLPPAYVLTVEVDPLRDEGIQYALRLMKAGVPVELHHFSGAFHGFDGLAPASRLAQRAFADIGAALAQVMAD